MWCGQTLFFLDQEAGGIILDTLESVDGGVKEAREERVAVVNGMRDRIRETSLAVASVVRIFLI